MPRKESPPPLGPYDLHEVISALRKEVKLGRVADAIYWLTVLLEYGDKKTTPRMVARQLWIVAGEDCDDPQVTLRAALVYQMADVAPETDHLYSLVAAMCRAPKWWATETGREVDRLWSRALGELRSNPREVPGYALDRHTRRGWEIKRTEGGWDDRFSGTDEGRMKTLYLWLRDGMLRPDLALDDGFDAFWAERVRLENPGTCSADDQDEAEQ